MTVLVRFASLSGKFTMVRTEEFATMAQARAAVEAHAASGGYTGVAAVEDVDSLRFTAKTPGGRSGRNIAFLDYLDEVQS